MNASSVNSGAIQISGARVNNLKNISCSLPHEQFIVITGPSGSGKSSLAFDTLYAEGQRRYIESMSSYARQFLARIEKPDVDQILHILPAIALEQHNSVKNARSTVGTATEIDDFIRLLYTHIGETRCDVCGGQVSRSDPLQIQEALQQLPEGLKVLLLAPVSLHDIPVETLQSEGFFRLYQNNEIVEINAVKDTLTRHETVQVVIDRLIIKKKALGARLLESIRNALLLGNGKIEALVVGNGTGEESQSYSFQNAFACLNCHKVFQEPSPQLFSFNSPLGACPSCEGFGRIMGIDMDKVIPNKTLTLEQGAIHPMTTPAYTEEQASLFAEAKKRKIPLNKPWQDLTEKQKAFVMDGGGTFEGVRSFFEWLETKKYKMHIRVMLAKYRSYSPCPVCHGSRLRPEALQVFVEGKNILDLVHMPVQTLLAFFGEMRLNPLQALIAQRLMTEIQNRLLYLETLGLSYLTLNRPFRTLSNGEAQRINLASALGGGLTDTLYVLDEPTVGLHARDTERLIRILYDLRDHGNTVVVVEHDPDVILAADTIIDMGPSGGQDGGRILYEGTPAGLKNAPYSLTARYLYNPPPFSAQNKVPSPLAGEQGPGKIGDFFGNQSQGGGNFNSSNQEYIEIRGARGNNLKNITVRFPKQQLVCVTGVSGSGKSTLIKQTLFATYEHQQCRSLNLDEAPCDALLGLEGFKDVLLVDQSPPGRSARSNPATYVKVYDDIRKVFASTRKATLMGITASHFSFNTPGGRCETCEGLGTLTIDMQFMADVVMVCPDCQGRRFNANVLSIEIEDQNIDAVLNMTVTQALAFFASHRRIVNALRPLEAIGLGYLKLGQSTSTLSGGEAQRLKLASYLPADTTTSGTSGASRTVMKSEKSETNSVEPYLFLFDEPSTGLHMADIALLVQAFRHLIAVGHSLIVIEHNLDLVAQADYVVDLGPEGGEGGGQVLAAGSVEDVMNSELSITGRYLRNRLGAGKHPSLCAE